MFCPSQMTESSRFVPKDQQTEAGQDIHKDMLLNPSE